MIEVIGLVNTFDRYSSINEEYKDFNRTLFIEMIKIKIELFSNYELMTIKGKRSFLKDLESTINLIIKPLYPFLKRSDYYVIFDLLLNNSRPYHDIYKEVMKCLISNLLEKDEYYQFLDNPNYLNTLEKELANDAAEYIKNINIFVACFIKLMIEDILKNNFDLLIDYLYYSFYEFNQNIIEENESFRVVFAVINFYLFCIYDKVPKTSRLRSKIELFIDSDDLGGYSYTSSFEHLVKHFDFKLSLFLEVCKETFNNCLSLIEKDGDSKDTMLEKAISWYLAILLKSPELDNDKIDTLLNVKETEDCKNLKNVLDFINNKCISKNGIYKPIGILKNIEGFNFGGNVFLDETQGTNESKFVTYLKGR